MIFPNVRLSELKADLELKRRNLTESTSQVKATLVEYANPLFLLKKKPWTLLGGLTSALVGFKIVKGAVKRRGWIGKALSLGGVMIAKKILPLAASALMSHLGGSAKKRRA